MKFYYLTLRGRVDSCEVEHEKAEALLRDHFSRCLGVFTDDPEGKKELRESAKIVREQIGVFL